MRIKNDFVNRFLTKLRLDASRQVIQTMKVLIVCNNAYMPGNGICTAVLSLVDRLKRKGIAVRLMACENPDPEGPQPEYRLKHFKFPFFEPIIYSNGFRYATFDKNIVTDALKWADIVHFCEGFPLEGKTARLAQKMGVPCVGTYHLLTENIMANLHEKGKTIEPPGYAMVEKSSL